MRFAGVLIAVLAFTGGQAHTAAAPLTPSFDVERIREASRAGGLSGDVVASDSIDAVEPGSPSSVRYAEYGLLPQPYRGGYDGVTWRWASVTKQIVAILVMQEVAAGRIDLDAPIAKYLPKFASPNAATATVRQLLQHRAGLPNPDDSAPGADGFPSFYLHGYKGSRDPLTGYCAGPVRGTPGGDWSYNNCDYQVAGALLEKVTGKKWTKLVDERIAKPLKLTFLHAYPGEKYTRFGMIDGKREPDVDLASFGAAAGLYGSPTELIALDFALMDGKLLPPDALATMWKGDPALGYMAIGQWVFEAKLAGCAAPVKIVERRGGVGGVEVRNFILPDYHFALAVFSDRAPFDFGEIWQGKGFSYDLLSAAVCPVVTE